MDDGHVPDDQRRTIIDTTLTINSFFGWEFNSCEALRQDGTWRPIDFANACPDSQVTSLHYHFPWLVAANLRWSIFCAATKRPMRISLDWTPYFEIADSDAPYEEKLAGYAAIANERFQTDEFESFCATHLGHLDGVVHDFFATEVAYDAVRQKVATLFPEHEIGIFTDLFWERIQRWRAEAKAEAAMSKTTTSWYSPRVERDVTVVRWGTFGTPVLVFPTAGGDGEEIERFQLVDACRDLIDAGRVKLYSVDSVNGRVLLAGEGDAGHQAWIQRQFFEFIRHEVVPAIRTDCGSDDIELVASGSSIGAFNALGCVCLFPDVFRLAICMSGTYDLRRFYPGPLTEDFYESSPLHVVPAMERRPRPAAPALHRAGQRRGRQRGHRGELDGARVLGSRAIPNRVDSWGPDWPHDWPLWRAMLPGYLDDLER